MKNIVFLFILSIYTEGYLSAQNTIDLPVDTVKNYDNSFDSIPNEEEIYDKPSVSPYAKSLKEYNSGKIDRHHITKDNWEKAKQGIDYSSDIIKERVQKEEKDTSSFNPIWAIIFELLKWVFIIGAVALLAFLIWKFVGEGNVFGGRARRIGATSTEIDLDNLEENLEKIDIDPLIKKAIEIKNYSLAIRLYFLAILKELSAAETIVWRKDKTNRIYIREMRPHRLHSDFQNATLIFEKVWYGNETLNENNFGEIQPVFQKLLTESRSSLALTR